MFFQKPVQILCAVLINFSVSSTIFAEEIVYENGNKYVGEVMQGVPHGVGTITFSNGTIFEGSFIAGTLHGRGTLKWDNGNYCTGDFLKNKLLHGLGRAHKNSGFHQHLCSSGKEGIRWQRISDAEATTFKLTKTFLFFEREAYTTDLEKLMSEAKNNPKPVSLKIQNFNPKFKPEEISVSFSCSAGRMALDAAITLGEFSYTGKTIDVTFKTDQNPGLVQEWVWDQRNNFAFSRDKDGNAQILNTLGKANYSSTTFDPEAVFEIIEKGKKFTVTLSSQTDQKIKIERKFNLLDEGYWLNDFLQGCQKIFPDLVEKP